MTMPDDKKQDETTAVANAPALSMAQQRKENEQYFKDPMAMVRAACTVMAKSQWGSNLSPDEVKGFEGIAQANGVSLTNGTAYVLGGNLYVSLQGRLKMAHESGVFGGFSVDRIMTADERKAYSIKDGELAWLATAIRFIVIGNSVQPTEYTDFGRASTTEKNPVAKSNPMEMAMKRARARALKLAFPCGLQSVEEMPFGEVIDVPRREPTKSMGQLVLEQEKAKKIAMDAKPKYKVSSAQEIAEEMAQGEKEARSAQRTIAIMEGQDPDVIPKPGEPESTPEQLDALEQAEYEANSDAGFEAAQKSEGEKGAK